MKKPRGRGPASEVDDATKDQILSMVNGGRSYAQVKKDLARIGVDVSVVTIGKYVKQARARARERGEEDAHEPAAAAALLKQRAEERPAAVALPTAREGATIAEQLQAQLAGINQAMQEAYQSGELKTAASYAKSAIDVTNQLLRAQKQERENATGTVLTAEDIAKAEQKIKDAIRVTAERPLLCAHCSRALSVDWGGGQVEPEAAQ